MKTMANFLLDGAEGMGDVGEAGQKPEIPEDAPYSPLTQCDVAKRDLSVANASEGSREDASTKHCGGVGATRGGRARRATATQRAASFWLSHAPGVGAASREISSAVQSGKKGGRQVRR